jgi:hypothetical protein
MLRSNKLRQGNMLSCLEVISCVKVTCSRAWNDLLLPSSVTQCSEAFPVECKNIALCEKASYLKKIEAAGAAKKSEKMWFH